MLSDSQRRPWKPGDIARTKDGRRLVVIECSDTSLTFHDGRGLRHSAAVYWSEDLTYGGEIHPDDARVIANLAKRIDADPTKNFEDSIVARVARRPEFVAWVEEVRDLVADEEADHAVMLFLAAIKTVAGGAS